MSRGRGKTMTQGTIFDDDIYNPHTLKSEIVANYIKVLSFDEALNRQEKLFIAKKWWGMVCDEAQKRCLGDLHKNIEDPDYDILVNHLCAAHRYICEFISDDFPGNWFITLKAGYKRDEINITFMPMDMYFGNRWFQMNVPYRWSDQETVMATPTNQKESSGKIDTKNTANEIIPHLDADIGIDNYTGIDEKDTSVKDRKDFDEPLLNGEEWTLDDDEYFEEAKQKVPQSVDNSKKSSRWGWFF